MSKFELLPKNKHIVVENHKTDEKIGSGILFAPGNQTNVYKLARVVAVHECDEAKGINPGDTVLYDSIGAVDHRVGNQSITTVKVLNVIGVVRQQPVKNFGEILDVLGEKPPTVGGLPYEEVPADLLEKAHDMAVEQVNSVIAVDEKTRTRQIELATKGNGPVLPFTEKIGHIEIPKEDK